MRRAASRNEKQYCNSDGDDEAGGGGAKPTSKQRFFRQQGNTVEAGYYDTMFMSHDSFVISLRRTYFS